MLAAYEHQRRFVGFDISQRYIKIARKRLGERTYQAPLCLAGNDMTNGDAMKPALDRIGPPSSNGIAGKRSSLG